MKIILSILGWVAAGILAFILIKGCGKDIPVTDTSKQDSLVRSKDSAIAKRDLLNDSLQTVADYWKNKYDSSWSALLRSKAVIIKQADSVRGLVAKYNFYKTENDTLNQLVSCGDLANQVDNLLGLLDQAKLQLDQVKGNSDSTVSSLQNLIASLRAEILDLKEQVSILKDEVSILKTANGKLAKKNKISSIIAKIGTATTVILAAILIIK